MHWNQFESTYRINNRKLLQRVGWPIWKREKVLELCQSGFTSIVVTVFHSCKIFLWGKDLHLKRIDRTIIKIWLKIGFAVNSHLLHWRIDLQTMKQIVSTWYKIYFWWDIYKNKLYKPFLTFGMYCEFIKQFHDLFSSTDQFIQVHFTCYIDTCPYKLLIQLNRW